MSAPCSIAHGDESRCQPDISGLWVRESSNAVLAKKLRAAANAMEAANAHLADLLTYLAPEPFPDPMLVRSFVAELEAASDGTTARFELFEEAQQNVVELARTSAEWTTPDDLSYLITELVGKIEPGAIVVDPACGTGGLLLMAGVADAAPETGARFLGADMSSAAARTCRGTILPLRGGCRGRNAGQPASGSD